MWGILAIIDSILIGLVIAYIGYSKIYMHNTDSEVWIAYGIGIFVVINIIIAVWYGLPSFLR